MKVEHIRTSQPASVTRLVTAFQWAATAALGFPTVGSGLVLVASSMTSQPPTDLLLWSPELLEVLFVVALSVGFVSGAYWPVFNGHSRAREEALLAPRRQSTMVLYGGLALYVLVSLMYVTTVTDLLQNLFAVGSVMLVCTYLYTYDVGSR